MYVGEFIGLVRKYFELNNAIRKHGRREDAIERWKIGKQIEAGLEQGIVVVSELKVDDPAIEGPLEMIKGDDDEKVS